MPAFFDAFVSNVRTIRLGDAFAHCLFHTDPWRPNQFFFFFTTRSVVLTSAAQFFSFQIAEGGNDMLCSLDGPLRILLLRGV